MARIRRETYLPEKMAKEQELFLQVIDGKAFYCTRRDNLADFVKPIITQHLATGTQPSILEIGCGSGNAMKKMLEYNPGLLADSISGTSLNPLPEHDGLRQLGMHVFTEIVAEFLPSAWTGMFDLVAASLVMQWTQIELAVPEVRRVLRPQGYFIGFDDQPVVARVEKFALRHGFSYEYTTETEKLWQRVGRVGYPFVFQKR